MTPKQEKFCVEYLVDLNGTQAAIRAGYSERTANRIANQLLSKLDIKNRIDELRRDEFKATIATAEEAEAFLAKAMRGNIEEEVVAEGRIIKKQISAKDRIKAAELIGKRNNLFSADTQIDITPIIIKGEGDIRE